MKRILALVLTIVMLFTMAACNFSNDPDKTPNESTTNEVTTSTPESTTPKEEVTTPEATTPEGTSSEETTPEGTSSEGTTPEGTSSEETTPDESTPKEDDPTIPEIEVSLPEASKVIASIIGVVAASVEVSEDAQFVFVREQYSDDADSNGYKQVMFFEVAEAVVDSNGEVLKAHLKVKIGEAEVEIPHGVSSKDIVVGKDAITGYFIFEVSVNGEDVSFTVNDQNSSANLSEFVYGKIAQMLGVDGIEGLENLVMTAAIAQELEKNLMPIIAKALDGVLADLPTVSPEYIEHLQALFAALGEDIMTVTTNEVTGNTTISLNIAAFKKLLEDVEGKTVAEYLESVYGENVAGALSSFLKSLPDKKVKDIVDAAVTLAEESGVEIKDIYALIDMYIYSVAGVEFSIEEQINTRYNNTLAELLAEGNGIKPEEQGKFIESMKASFANVADMIETISIDALLSSMFMGTNKGFIENLKATIDMFDEQIVYNLTVDADGYVLALNYSIGDLQYSMVVEGDDTIMTVSMPNGAEFVVTVNNEGFAVVVKQDGEQIAAGSMTVTEEINGEDVVATVVADLRDSKNDLLDYTAVSVNGVITELDVVIRGYNVEYDSHYYPETNELIENYEKEIVEILTVEYKDLTGDLESAIATIFNATIKEHSGKRGESHTHPATGEYSETWVEEYCEWLTIEYSDFSNGGLVLNLLFGEHDAPAGSVSISVTEKIVDEDVVTTVVIDLCDDENDLLDYTAVSVNGVITQIDAEIRGYLVEEEWVETPMTDEELEDYYDKLFGTGGITNGDFIIVPPEGGSVTITPVPGGSVSGDYIYGDFIIVGKPVTKGEWVRTETFVTFLTVDFDDFGDEAVLKIGAHESVMSGIDCITLTTNNNQITAVLTQDDELVANVTLSFAETGLSVEVNNATEQVFQAGIEIIDNEEGEDFIRVEYQGVEVIYGYKVDENGVKFAVYNNGDEVVALFEAVKNDGSVVLTAVLGPNGDELLSAVVTLTAIEGGLIVDIDLDKLQIRNNYDETCYVEFDGAITFKVA